MDEGTEYELNKRKGTELQITTDSLKVNSSPSPTPAPLPTLGQATSSPVSNPRPAQPTQPVQQTQPTQQTQQNPTNKPISRPTSNNTNQQVQQPINMPTSSVVVEVPNDLYDSTVQGYLNAYNEGKNIHDFQAQINALTALDNYRTSNGYSRLYTNNIYALNNERNQKIQNQIQAYENDIANAYNLGNYELAQQKGQELEQYKRMVNYREPVVDNTASYLDTVEYKSTYDDVINGIVEQLLTDKFTYDPSDDEALIKAQEQATNKIYESMNARGILDSTMTAQIVAKTVSNLASTYEQMAKEDFYKNIDRLQSVASLIMNLEKRQYDRWQANVQLNLEKYEARRNEIDYQWERVNKIGYVDNEASMVLGIAPGMLSPATREAMQEVQAQTQKKYDELYTDIQLASAKADIEAELYAKKKAIDAQYKTTISGGTTIDSNGNIVDVEPSSNLAGMSDTDKKTTIKQKYKNGEYNSDYEAIIDIYSNFEAKKVPAILSSIMGITEKQATDIIKNEAVNADMDLLRNEFGSITEANREQVESAILIALDNKNLDEATADKLLEEVEKEIKYNDFLTRYINGIQQEINILNNSEKIKKSLRKSLENRKPVLEGIDHSSLIGEERFELLKEAVEAKELELAEALRNKGVEWNYSSSNDFYDV